MNKLQVQAQPCDINAETGVIASILLDSELMAEAIRLRLTNSSFFEPRHQIIFSAMEELFNKGGAIDSILVSEVLKNNNLLLEVGGFPAIHAISTLIDNTASFLFWVKIVKKNDLRRQLIKNAKAIEEEAYNDNGEVAQLIDKSIDRIFGIQQLLSPDETLTTNSSIDWAETIPDTQVIPTCIPTLNKHLRGGYRPTELNILAARPGMGKTTLAIQMALEALKRGRRVVFVSLEMSRVDIKDKMISSLAGRNVEWVREELGFKSEQIKKYLDWCKKVDFSVMTTTGKNVHHFVNIIEKIHRQKPIDLLVIDYLQLMPTTNKGSRNDQVAEISRMLKVMAMEMKISTLALSQLSREGEKVGRAPIPSDLRDSGSLEQDANSILFIYQDKDDNYVLGLKKNRMGECGSIKVNVEFYNNRFLEIDVHAKDSDTF